MADNEIRVDWRDLREFTATVFNRAGVPREDADTEAEVLVWANLRGVDSHGVLRIPWYVENLDTGVMNPSPQIRVSKETPATVLIDADRALGPVVTVMAMRRVIEKARNVGVGWGLIRETTHQGAMAYYPLMAAEAGMAGIASVCSPPNMAPFGAKAAGVHNSPIAIAAPGNESNLVLDMATSVVAGGKLNLATDKGQRIPVGWAIDLEGNPTTDPSRQSILLPAGGPKGSGLALMFECLSSLMVGNPLLEPSLSGTKEVERGVQNSFIAAVDIATFTDADEYRSNVDKLIEAQKALPPADGVEEVMVPGEPENRTYKERSANGIPLPQGTVANLRSIASRFEVPLPAGL